MSSGLSWAYEQIKEEERSNKLTEKQMDAWVETFNSWDVCDQVCMNLFNKSPFVLKKIFEGIRLYAI